jgi:hypothetical protein
MTHHWKRKAPLFILAIAAGILVFTGIIMLLWNAILPAVLHVGAISFWQAMGILALSKILFGGFRGRRHFGGGWQWKRQMYVKWQNMTDEEREKMKDQFQCYGRRWQQHDNVKPAV